MSDNADKMSKKVEDAFFKSAKAGDMFGVRLTSSLRSVTISFADATKKAVNAREEIKRTSAALIVAKEHTAKVTEEYTKSSKSLENLRARHEELRKEYEATGGTDEKLYQQLLKTEERLKEKTAITTKMAAVVKVASGAEETLTDKLNAEVKVIDEAEESMANYYERLKDVYLQHHKNVAMQQTQVGGFKAFSGSVKYAVLESGQLSSALNMLATGGLVLYGLKKLGDAFSEVASYTQTARAAAMQMGDASKGMGASLWDSQKAILRMTELSGMLGMSLEEVQGIASKFRLGTVLDRNGQLGEEAVQGLTKEAALFARTAGIDAAQSAEMLDKRIRGMGMSSAEAIADLQGMRQTLVQMAAANTKNNVPLKEMVDIVEEARNETSAYVVDTRILTTALRTAATQASDLGAASKQAADVAKGVGKVLSKAPDFIKIPAGFNLVDKLMGADFETFLQKYDKATQKQLRDLHDQVQTGATARFTAAQVMMDLVGGESDAIEATFEQTKKYIKSGVSANIIAQQYGIENMATANLVVNELRDLAKMQEKYKGIKLTTAIAMVGQETEFKQMMGEVKDERGRVEKLKEKGFTDKDAKLYIDTFNDMEAKQEELNKLRKEGNRDVKKEQELEDAIVKDKLKKADLAQATKDPTYKALQNVRELTKDLKDASGNPITVEVGTDLKALGQPFDKVADALGLEGEARKRFKKEFWDTGNEVNIKNAGVLKQQQSDAIKKQDDQWDSIAAKFSQGFFSGFGALIDKYLPFLKGGFAKILTAIAAFGLVFVGAGRLVRGFITRQTDKVGKVVEHGTYKGALEGVRAAMKSLPPGRGGGGDEGPGDGMTTEHGKGGKPTRRTSGQKAGRRFKVGWKQLRTKGHRWAGVKSLGKGLGHGIAGMAKWGVGAVIGTEALGDLLPSGESGEAPGTETTTPTTKPTEPKPTTPTEPKVPKSGKLAKAKGWMKDISGKAWRGAKKPFAWMAKNAGKLKGVSKAASLLKSGLGLAVKGGSKVGLGLLKGGLKLLKLGRAVPFIGSIIGAGFAIYEAWNLYSKWKQDPKSITASDKARMVMALASMVPGIGTAVAIADVGAEVSGAYDKLDQITADTGTGGMMAGTTPPSGGGMPPAPTVAGIPAMNAMPTASAVAGTPTGVPQDATQAGQQAAATARGGGGGGGGTQVNITGIKVKGGPQSIGHDGNQRSMAEVRYEVINQVGMIAQSNKLMSQNRGGMPS
jgi:hypothetical protein